MFQQIIAIIIIIFIIFRLFWQKQKKQISFNEFVFWLVFWILALLAMALLKWIDRIVAGLGFSGTGIEILFYFGVVILFYFIFKLRLRLERIEKDITKIVKHIALNNKSNK